MDGLDALTTSLTTGIQSIAGNMLGLVGDVTVAALPICGGICIVMLGLRIFKRVAS